MDVMSSQSSSSVLIASRRVELPGRVRRVLLLVITFSSGAILAVAFPYPAVRTGDVVPFLVLALLAGVSSLWSP